MATGVGRRSQKPRQIGRSRLLTPVSCSNATHGPSFAIHDISGIPGSPMDRVGDSGSGWDPGGDPKRFPSIFGRILQVRENPSPRRLRRDHKIRDRSHACEPGHVADLVTTTVQGPRAARSGGWEISSGRANHKGHPLSSTTPEYHSLHHTTPTKRWVWVGLHPGAIRAPDLDRPE